VPLGGFAAMSLPHMILGLLTWNSFSGYDLNKVFQETVQHFWWTEQSQIYRALHKVEEQGWVEVEDIIQTENPNKKVYHLTSTGREELLRWLAEPMDETHTREAWVGKLFFGDLLSQDTLIHLFEVRIQQIEGLAIALERDRSRYSPGFDLVTRQGNLHAMTLDYGITMLRAQIDWMQSKLEIVRQFDGEAGEEGNRLP